jgi:hypothetical protein
MGATALAHLFQRAMVHLLSLSETQRQVCGDRNVTEPCGPLIEYLYCTATVEVFEGEPGFLESTQNISGTNASGFGMAVSRNEGNTYSNLVVGAYKTGINNVLSRDLSVCSNYLLATGYAEIVSSEATFSDFVSVGSLSSLKGYGYSVAVSASGFIVTGNPTKS